MPLPAQVDPRKLALRSAELVGDVPVSCMSRLASATVRINDPAKATIVFKIDESGFTLISGSVSVPALAQCQRCLHEVDICIESEFKLRVVSQVNEEDWKVKFIDPLVIDKGILNLYQMLEDELILALPIVNYHETEQCANNLDKFTYNSSSNAQTGPFDILKQLKN